jgi:hypothetical protein
MTVIEWFGIGIWAVIVSILFLLWIFHISRY